MVEEWVVRNGKSSEKFGMDNLVLHYNILPSLKWVWWVSILKMWKVT